MAISDKTMRRQSRFYISKANAIKDAKQRGGVVIQAIRGRQWVVVSGEKSIAESLKRLRESCAYLGMSPPKIIRDYRRYL